MKLTNPGKTSIRRLLDIDGKLILNSKGILKKLKDFYKALYSNQDSQDHEQFFPEFRENDYTPKLCDDQKNSTLYHTPRMVNRLETMVLHQNFIKNSGISLDNF